jgi:hypothetical protein
MKLYAKKRMGVFLTRFFVCPITFVSHSAQILHSVGEYNFTVTDNVTISNHIRSGMRVDHAAQQK